MGSIPPAGAVEYPQREITNFISVSNIAPSDYDLLQLAKSVQSGAVNYGVDTGPANDLQIMPVVPVSAYVSGLRFVIKVNSNNTTACTLNVNGIGRAPLVHMDLSPLGAGELSSGQLADVAYDGANFQVLSGANAGGGGLIILTAPRTLYVNVTIGSDTLYDGTAPTVGTASSGGIAPGPFKTVRHAVNETAKYNLSGFTFNIVIADGVYPETTIINAPTPNGSGAISLQGNTANPNNVKLYNTGSGSVFQVINGLYLFDGVSFQATAATPSDEANCFWIASSGSIRLYNVNFYGCPGSHVLISSGATASINGPIGINAGSMRHHVRCERNGIMISNPAPPPTLNINGAVTCNEAFSYAAMGGQLTMVYTKINGASNVTGKKYLAFGNGVIQTNGGGINYYPGTVAGTTASGGQYL